MGEARVELGEAKEGEADLRRVLFLLSAGLGLIRYKLNPVDPQRLKAPGLGLVTQPLNLKSDLPSFKWVNLCAASHRRRRPRAGASATPSST
jgi:hypothetical protein